MSVVSYVLSLESRQFLSEMVKVRASAVDFKGGMKDAQDMANGFNSASTALAQAMSGNLVGAAKSAATAIRSMTAAMVANPVLALVAALAALGAMLYKVAEAHREYKARCAEARIENEKFLQSLAQIGTGGPLEEAEGRFREQLDAGRGRGITRTIENAEISAGVAKREAEAAGAELKELMSAKRPDEEAIKAAREKRDAAVEEYKLQLDIVARYKAMYREWSEKRKDAAAKDAAGSQELRDANAAEVLRREQEQAKAGGDLDKMAAILLEMERKADEKFGTGEMFDEMLKAGMASREEIAARKEIDDWRKEIDAETRRQRDAAKRAEEVAAREAEQKSKAEATAKATEKEKLAREAEQQRRKQEEEEEEARKLEERRQDWMHRNDTGAQALQRNRKALLAARDEGDVGRMLDLMEEGERLAEQYEEPKSRWDKRKEERRARRDTKAAIREARSYRRTVRDIERRWAMGDESVQQDVDAMNEKAGGKFSFELKDGKMFKIEGQNRTNELLEAIKRALE